MTATDVVVIGAGPAGSAAAIEFARAGRKVALIDKAAFPRDKCCGDGLTTEALRQLEELGLEWTDVAGWNAVSTVRIRSPRGREVRLPLPSSGQFAAVAPRRNLDDRLVRTAVAAGATLHEAETFLDIEATNDRVVVTTDKRTLQTRYVVAADGMWSNVRRQLGLNVDGYRGEWHAFRQYFSKVGPGAEELVVWFDEDLLPGYAWSFPLPGRRANVGFGIKREGRLKVGDMGKLWNDLLDRPHVRAVLGPDATPEDRHRAWPIPARVDRLDATAHRILFVGDAAAATDPMTGEGIAQALGSGRWAAQAILQAGAMRPQLAAETYETMLRRALVPDHRLARQLAGILESPLGARGALRVADLTPWTRRNFARWMFEDYPRAAVLTPRRWRRGLFSGGGAYADTAPTADLADPLLVSTSS
ncbi:MAG: NAD(P)/FAD-dependent oxidoreductase [Acidimicrobiales bacterium]